MKEAYNALEVEEPAKARRLRAKAVGGDWSGLVQLAESMYSKTDLFLTSPIGSNMF